MADTKAAIPASPSKTPTVPITIEFHPWPTSTSQYRDPNKTWQDMNAPAELRTLPDGDEIAPELREIVDWSMIRPSDTQSTASTSTSLQNWLRNESKIPELPANQSEDSSTFIIEKMPPEPNEPVESNEDASSILTACPSQISRSRSRDRHQTTLRQLKSTLLSSPSDLYNEIKESIDQKRNARAERDSKQKMTVECISCFDDTSIADAITLSCTHAYCKKCIRSLITTAMQTESSFPPKCCLTEIPLKTVLLALNRSQRDLYRIKLAEYSVPPGNRWYCPQVNCAKFIPPSKLSRSGSSQKCPYCGTEICRVCRGEAHNEGTDCPQDYGLEAALESAETEGWQRCFRCRTMVELTTGCRHITCKCGAEFCYVCGLRWRTCGCTETDLINLRVEVTRRRNERSTAAQIEELEIGRAIAEVEAFERQRVEEIRQENLRLERERREEEQQLAQLEELRLQDEARRMQEEQDAERERVEVARLSIAERGAFLKECLQRLIDFQQSSLVSRHEREEQILDDSLKIAISSQRNCAADVMKILLDNAKKRRLRMEKQQHEALSTLCTDHESREDAVFLHLQNYLRGKPNREAREERMLGKFREQLKEETARLTQKQKEATGKYEAETRMEKSGLEKADQSSQDLIKEEHDRKFSQCRSQAGAMKEYFEFITKRRISLLQSHLRIMLEELEQGLEPTGLTREVALDKMLLFASLEDQLLAVDVRVAKPVPTTWGALSLKRNSSDLPELISQRASGSTNSDQVGIPSTPKSGSEPEVMYLTTAVTTSKTSDDGDMEVAVAVSTSETDFVSTTPSLTASPRTTSTDRAKPQPHAVHWLRTTMRTASISTTKTESASVDGELALKKSRGKKWSLFGGKGNGREKFTDEQIRELLRGTMGDAF